MLIHYQKTFGTYLFFASTLVGLSQQLQGVRAFGTDGEKALADAFMHEFTYSQRLTCFIHVKRNVKDKCNDLSIPSDVTQKIIDDIFGHTLADTFIEGLVDSENDIDFQEKVDSVVSSWREMPTPSSVDMEGFISWFLSHKVQTIRDSMLRSVREECGLGSPPAAFTTNGSESLNAMLKHKVDYKKNELPLFIEKVKELVNEQRREVERAVIGRGKYRILEQYQSFIVPESQWFLMTPAQRKNHLSKFHTAAVKDPNDILQCSDSMDTNISPIVPHTLSCDVTNASEKLDIPLPCLQGIWSKAEKLLTTKEAIVPAPGQAPEARMVLSYSGKVPHMVTPNKSRSFCCDSSCVNWKSLGICSHTVAVAEVNGKLLQFLSLCKKKKKPNLTSLLTTDLPKGSGRKGAVPPRKRKSKEPVSTHIGMSINKSTSIDTSVPTCCPNTHAQTYPLMQSPDSSSVSVQFSPYTVAPQCNVLQSPYIYGSAFSYNYPVTNPNWHTGYSSPFTFNPHNYKPTVPFQLAFITGNISCCFGCRGKYSKSLSLSPPADLCIKHQDWREFTSTSTGTPQSRYGNVYYHCKPDCVWLRNPSFVPAHLIVPEEILEKLTSVHKDYLSSVFGLALSL